MSTDSSETNDSGHTVPTQDSYVAETQDTRWVELEDFDGAFKVREVAPLSLLRDMQKYNVSELLGGDADDVDIGAIIQDGNFGNFLEEVVLPNIDKPTCYWSDVGEGDFDLAALTAEDLMTVIAGLTGRDPSELEDQMDDTFHG